MSIVNHAQDPNFTMFYNNPTYYNPAMTAINKGLTYRANVRNQWRNIQSRFNTFNVSFEGETNQPVSIGVNLLSDVAGEGFLRTVGGVLSYAYCPEIKSDYHMFQLGVSTGYINKYIDWSRLAFSDQYDEVLGKIYNSNFIPPDNNSYSYVDLGTGFVYQFLLDRKTTGFFKKMMLNLGVSGNHLNSPKDAYFSGDQYIPWKLVIHSKNQFLLGNNVYTFAGIYETQHKFQTMTVGFNFQYKNSLILGIWNRAGRTINGQRFESIVTSVGALVSRKENYKFRLSYSYDFTISELRPESIGTHEVSLVYMIDDKYLLKRFHEKRKKQKMFKCPADFKGF
jgi:type IX secretion system PorP/SprF family membrane protein